MKLAGFEWRKMFSGKIPGLFLSFFLLNMITCYVYMIPFLPTRTEQNYRENWEKTLSARGENIPDTMTFLEKMLAEASEKVEKAPNDRYASAELKVLNELEREYQSVRDYQKFIENLDERVAKMRRIAIFNKQGSFSKRNIEKTSRDFEDVKDLELYPANDSGMNVLHNFYLTDILCLLLICLFAFQEYGRDFHTGMSNLIQAAPGGKERLRLAQMMGLGFADLMTCVCFYGGDFLLIGTNLGFGNLNIPVQGMAMFRNVSYPCTVRQYLVYFFLWKFLAFLFVTIIVQLLAVWFNGHRVSWILNFLFMGVSFMLWFLLPESSVSRLFRYLNPIGLLDVRQILGNYQNLNIFQYPVSILAAATVFLGVMALLLGVGILLVDHSSARFPSIAFPFHKKKRIWKQMFSYEWYKLVVNQKVWFLLVLLIPASVLWITPWQNRVRLADYSYEEYLDSYKGAFSEQKFREIQALPEQTDYQIQEGLDRLRAQADYLRSFPAENRGFVSIRMLDNYFQNLRSDTKCMALMVGILLLSVSSLFFVDKKQQMHQLLRAYPGNRCIYWDKIKLSALLGFLCAVCVWGTAWFKFFLHHKELEGLSFSLQSLPVFAENPYTGSIFSYMLLSLGLRLLTGIYLGIVLALIAQILPEPSHNITCAAMLFLLPLCMSYIGNLGYENPLSSFLTNYMSPVLNYAELLCQFPIRWFQLGTGDAIVILLLPLICVVIGSKIWEK